MGKFIARPKSKQSLNQLSDGVVVYAIHDGDVSNVIRYIISDSVPGMERMVRPETDFYYSNDLSVDEFINLGWEVMYAVEASLSSIRELALVSSRIQLEAENGVDFAQYVWLGELEPRVREWAEEKIQEFV